MGDDSGNDACCGSCAHARLVEEGKISYAASPPLRVAGAGEVVLFGRNPQEAQRVPLARGGRWVIGRVAAQSDIAFPADGSLGRRTCAVEVDLAGQVFVEDLGASCGTFVNGKRIIRSGLHERDEIRIGNQTVITFERAD